MNNQIIDNSGDKKYFTITPQIVWALSRSPYDHTLWNTIKMIAGDDGECWVSTENLAKLSMMSMGKVSESRKYLIDIGLLIGEQKQAYGNGQNVWHLSIPDLWEDNIKWRTAIGDSLSARIKLKTTQKDGKKSLHTMKASLYEGKPSPDETKDNPVVEPSLSSSKEEDVPQSEIVINDLEETITEQELKKQLEEQHPIKEEKEQKAVSPAQPGPAVSPPPVKPKSPRPAAVDIYRSIAHKFPDKALWEMIDEIVGNNPDDLELWRQVIFNYIACGWYKGSIKNMLDFFKRGEIPGDKKLNGNYGENKPNGTHQKNGKSTLDEQPTFDPYTGEYCYPDGRREKASMPSL